MTAAFITTGDLSDRLGRDVTADDGATALVSQCCALIRSIAEMDFNAGAGTAVLDGVGSDALILPQALTVQSISSVAVNGAAVTDYMVTETGVLLRGTAGGDPRPTWPSGRQNVKVVYNYGYATLEVPEDVCAVALDLAHRKAVQGVASSESLAGVSVSYGVPVAGDLTKNEERILRRWRSTRSF
jgi:hypothetical protein